ncbi:DUF3703 domain-containing protein [Halopseudomonas laoshanensis]|uniref:DUF3703 domain-containing protein n=2 Tax=Halopseudomonas TaxID=2901189 RepID=A0A7V7GUN4_9GAMM|nr:DUF3703 domain-containing protein [Halopseudomonas laoshanensis]MBQ0741870.1 DUF3703 domain-containing protein [Pseudomonas sp.]PCC98761.1 hypothetical protein CO192_14000 [Halopseudomonas pelagia]KAA0695273.1 DUF3703 domain-containing protein [Halopseudomonas laoshanensis]MBQ0777379.1 DUF3703 domain-containing protein [Pseudomonas sp.]QFY58400.1 DUF3703 domain-containing protein [Halopseudomonas pelagia]
MARAHILTQRQPLTHVRLHRVMCLLSKGKTA